MEGKLGMEEISSDSSRSSILGLDPAVFREAIQKRSREINDLTEYRYSYLEAKLEEKEKLAAEQAKKLTRMKEDFDYNLKLIQERDAELEKYDITFANLSTTLKDKDSEISEIRISLAHFEDLVMKEKKRNDELETYYQEKIVTLKDQVETLRWKKDEEIRQLRTDSEAKERDAKRRMRELEEQISSLRVDSESEFDEAVRKREEEHRRREEELVNEADMHRKRCQELTQEVDQRKRQNSEDERKMQKLQQSLDKADGKVKELQALLENARSENETNIQELQRKLDETQDARERLLQEYHEKMEEAARNIAELELMLQKQRDEYTLQQRRVNEEHEKAMQSMAEQMERESAKVKTDGHTIREENEDLRRKVLVLQGEMEDQAKQHLRELEEADRKMESQEHEKDREIRTIRGELVSRETEAEALRDRLEAQKRALDDRKKEIDALKREIVEAGEREAKLRREIEQTKFQMETDDSVRERQAILKSEEIIQTFKTQRDEARAEVQELREKLHASVQNTRKWQEEAARAQQQQHVAPMDGYASRRLHVDVEPTDVPSFVSESAERGVDTSLPAPSPLPPMSTFSPTAPGVVASSHKPASQQRHSMFGSSVLGGAMESAMRGPEPEERARVAEIESQNQKLRGVVKEMRREMESLYKQFEESEAKQFKLPQEIKGLEDEVVRLQGENQYLLRQRDELARQIELNVRAPREDDSMQFRLEFDRVEAELLRSRSYATSLELEVNQLRDEVRRLNEQQPSGSHGKPSRMFSDGSAGKSDGQIQQVLDVVNRLQKEMEVMKVDHITSDTASGPRDILVQLNREVSTLREDIESRREKYRKLERHYCAIKKENKALKMKLKEAAKDIRRLMEDREKLMDISNAMKANMTRLGTDSFVRASSDGSEGVLSQKVKELAMITEELKTENRMLRVQLDRWPGEKSQWSEHAKKEAVTLDHDDMDDILDEELPTKRKISSSSGNGMSSSSKRKLDGVRKSLEVAGYPPVFADPPSPIPMSQRSVPSQRKSLSLLKKRKEETAHDHRKAVRHYGIRDPLS